MPSQAGAGSSGRQGEQAVAEYLRQNGCFVIQSNYRAGRGLHDEIDIIACGSDFDGGITSQMDNPALFASFGDYMVEHGISRRVSDKIMFENALHFFEENIK